MRTSLKIFLTILALTTTKAFEEETPLPNTPKKVRTLVLIDNLLYYTTHSQFFKNLGSNGHKVTIKFAREDQISNGQISLQKDRRYLYDNLILMCTSLADLPETKNFNVKQFFDDGNNVFFALDFDTSDYFRRLANEFGFKIPQRGEYLVDYKNAIDRTEANIFRVKQFRDIKMFSEGVENDLVYNGISLGLTHFDNRQMSILARGNMHTASISQDGTGKKIFGSMGKHNMLVIGIQGLNNARCVVLGSVDMLSNELDIASKGSNGKYAMNLVGWLSSERGVVREVRRSHSCIDKNGEDSDCPVRCKFRFSIDVRGKNNLN